MRHWPEFCRDERGNMAILFAVGFTVSAVLSAVAVDAAALYHERRVLQAGVDLAAISAAADPSRAAEIAQSVLAGARLLAPASTDGLTVTTGHYNPSGADIAQRYAVGAVPVNAVSVSLRRSAALHFAGSFASQPVIGAAGTAMVAPEVSFSIGSRLAGLNGGLANAVLSDLLGLTLSFSVADYTALAAVDVSLLSLLDALAPRLGVTVGTYSDLLHLDAPAGTLAAALAETTTGSVRTLLLGLAASGSGHVVPLAALVQPGRIEGLQLGSAGTGLGPKLSVLDVLAAAAALADGDRQVAVNLGASVPGLTSLRLDLVVGEREQRGGWLATGTVGTLLRTAQVRLRLRAELLGGPVLLGAGVKLPLWLDLAYAEARVAAATCPSPASPRGSASIAVRPGAAQLALGEISDTALGQLDAIPPPSPVSLVDVLLLKIRGSARVDVAQPTPIVLGFSSADIEAGLRRTATTTTPVASLVGSLLGNLDLTVSVLGLGLSSPTVIAQSLRTLLAPLAPVLDSTISGTLKSLGISVGSVDVRVHHVRCDHAVLVG